MAEKSLLPGLPAAATALTAGMVSALVVDSLLVWMAGSSLDGWRALVTDLVTLLVAFDVGEATYKKLR
jgi:hypothetical protein